MSNDECPIIPREKAKEVIDDIIWGLKFRQLIDAKIAQHVPEKKLDTSVKMDGYWGEILASAIFGIYLFRDRTTKYFDGFREISNERIHYQIKAKGTSGNAYQNIRFITELPEKEVEGFDKSRAICLKLNQANKKKKLEIYYISDYKGYIESNKAIIAGKIKGIRGFVLNDTPYSDYADYMRKKYLLNQSDPASLLLDSYSPEEISHIKEMLAHFNTGINSNHSDS